MLAGIVSDGESESLRLEVMSLSPQCYPNPSASADSDEQCVRREILLPGIKTLANGTESAQLVPRPGPALPEMLFRSERRRKAKKRDGVRSG